MFGRKKEAQLPPGVYPDEEVTRLVADFPRFGEEPFLAATDKRPPRPILDDLEYVRRILISWLIGRPVSEIAKRVGCSERSVRNVIEKVIYVDEYDLESGWSDWIELGLIGALDVAVADQASSWLNDPDVSQVTVICQVCHRQIGMVHMLKSMLGERQGSEIELDVLARGLLLDDELARRHLAEVQGHLILHFYIGIDKIAVNTRRARHRAHRYLQSIEWIPANQPFSWYSNRHHYTQIVSRHAIGVLPEEGEPDLRLLTPVIDGRPMSIYDARRRWKQLIK